MAEPRWLNEKEQQAWRAFIAAQRVVNTRIEQQLQRDAGIPHTYFEILVRLSEAPDGRLRMSELAVATLGSRSRLSHAVNRLEQAGWVRREGIESDRRGQVAIITDLGRQKLVETAPGHVEEVRQVGLRRAHRGADRAPVRHLRHAGPALRRHGRPGRLGAPLT